MNKTHTEYREGEIHKTDGTVFSRIFHHIDLHYSAQVVHTYIAQVPI